jgi:hypothetical protein
MYIDGKILEYPQAKRITKNNGEPMDIQLMILETFDTYPRKVAIQFIDKKIELLNQVNYNPVRVHINPESRNSGENWFTSLNGWKVEPMPMAAQAGAPQNAAPAPAATPVHPAAAPVQPQYKIGDVVNGYILTVQGWSPAQNIPQPITNSPQPITQTPTTPPPPPAHPAPQVQQPAPSWGAPPAAPAPAPTPVQQWAAPAAAPPPANPSGGMFDANGNIIADPRELF